MSLLFVFFLCVSGCLAVDNPIFYGGSMSFSTFHDDRDNTTKVHLKLLTGWKIGTGPCGRSCPRSRTRTSTIQSRKNMLDAKGDNYFGNWEMEVSKSTSETYHQNLTTIVKTNLTEKVESVNPRLEWELDTADLFVAIPDNVRYVDIIFEGNSWLELTVNKLTTGPPWHLQVKVNPHERSDTLGPNRSPIVQMKPFFKLGMNKTYAISLTAMDEDDDAIQCRSSRYVEAGPRLTSHKFRNADVDLGSCTINIDTTDSTIFHENATGAIAVTVQDYARKVLKLNEEDNLVYPYETVLSAVTVQFFVFIVEHADEPIFVPPTHQNQQTFIIYVGVEFTVDFYARPTAPDANRKIELFDVTRTGGRETNQTEIKFITNRTAKITVSWIPVDADLGKDILCARAEDNQGFESINLHCFTILIKPYTPHPQTPLQARPYFVFFPQPGDIVFPEHSFCKFPIYAASSTKGGITNISIHSTDAPSAIVVGVIRPVNSTYGPGAKMAEIQLKEPVGGVRKICFEASDADSSTVQCLFANVLKKDPCETNPCNNGGICFPSEDHNDFFCHCNKGFKGRTCDNAAPNVCLNMNTCLNNARCIPKRGGIFFCLCGPGYTGVICENKVDKCLNNPCGEHGICIDGDTPSCNCTDGFTGKFCNTSTPTSVINNCNGTSSSLCQNEGICLIKSGQQMCICPVGLNGSSCESIVVENKLMFVPPTPEKDSVLSCNVGLSPMTAPFCEFPVYIQASSTPSVKSISSNTDLDVTTLQSEKFTLQGVNNIYMTLVKLSQTYDSRSGTVYEFCLQASLTSELASRCFSVDFEALPSPPHNLQKHSWDFIAPTPEKNTTFRCQLGQYCHVVVYTLFKDHCEQVLVTNSLGGKAFPTKEMSNKCVTDVVFTDVDSEGKHQVCLKSWKNGESRCYFVDVVKDIEGVCDPNPCKNGGLCLQKDEMPFCICMTGYFGDNCTKGQCPSVNTQCKNGAFCFTNGKHETCFCQTGFSGPNCTHDSAENITDLQHNGAKFTDAVFPTNITCFVSNPCKIPHIVTGSPTKNPLFGPGYLSPGIKIEEIKFDKHHNSTHVYHTTTIVKAETTGQKKICLQIYNEQRLASDEACFNITVVKGFEHENQLFAHFIPPTPSNNTEMECEVGRPCHLNLWTSNKLGVNSCPFVKSNMKSEEGVYVFQEAKSVNPCMNDVSIQIPYTGVSELCFSVLESSDSKKGTREIRCYQLKIVSTLSVKSACINVKCKNGGFCDSNTLSGDCICVLGFSGHNCEIQRGVSLMTNAYSTILTDLAMPEKIMCHLKEKCDISFSIGTNSSSKPNVKLGHYSGDIIVTTPVLYTEQLSLNSYLGHFTVSPNTIGTHVVCIQTSTDMKLTTDERCIDVVVENNKTKTSFNKNLPHFQTPTLPNNTQVACPSSKTCHIVLNLSPGLNERCPEIQQTKGNSDFTHVFNLNRKFKEIGNNCTADVAIKPSSNHNSSDLYCFDVSFPSVPGEKRCFNVTYKEPEKTLCVGFLCENGGFCETKGLQATCKCPITSSGKNCQSFRPLPTSSSVTSLLAVTTSLATHEQTSEQPVTTSDKLQNPLFLQGRPYFLSFPMNKTTKCVQNVLCTFNVYAISTFCRDISHIENIPNSEENVTIHFSTQIVGMMETKAGRVEFLPRTTGLRKICLKASDCHSFTQKCHHITIVKNNPCESSPCHNGGQCFLFNGVEGLKCSCKYGYTGVLCETKIRLCMDNNPCRDNSTCIPLTSEPFYKCLCSSGKTGVRCEIDEGYRDVCKNSSRCKNNAACHFENQSESCICRLGYSGPTCSIEANKNLSHPAHTGAKFTTVALPKSVICYVAFRCSVPFTVTKSIFNKPTVVPGYTDTSIHITNYELDHETLAGGIVHGVLEVVGFSLGSASICIDSVDTAGKSRIEDEICFEVQVINGNYYKQHNDVPHFVNPSFETNSMFHCLVGDYCHLNMWAVNDINERDCPVLKSEKNFGYSVFVLPPLNQTLSPCIYDVALISNTATNDTLCLYLEGDGGVVFDRRCYIIEITASMRKGSCANDLCFNDGFCDGHTTSKKCLCRIGFSGENCSSNNGIPQASNQHKVHHPLFGNMVLPTMVVCPLNDECKLQLLVSTKTEFEFGINADPSNIEIIELEEHQVSEDFLITLTVVHRKTGSHNLCVNLTSKTFSLVTDTHCINIFSKDTVTASTACAGDMVDDCRDPAALQFICADPSSAEYCRKSCKLCDVQKKEESEELFLPPSPTNTSSFSCSPGLECHMMLYLRRGYNDICPEVLAEPTTGAFVSILNNLDCHECSVDVLIKLSLSHPGQRVQQCLQAIDNDFGVLEKRCFFLENVMHSST